MLPAFSKIKKNEIYMSRTFLALLILFCIFSGSLPIFGNGRLHATDEVYCPLQKKWVKQNPVTLPEPIDTEKPLANICTSNNLKENFLADLLKSFHFRRISADQKEEEVFFNYLDKGKQAFAEIALPFNSPEHQLAKSSRTEKSSSGNYQKDFGKISVETFLTKQHPRPPTTQKNTVFNYQIARKLKNLSRNINPRSPPFSI